MTGIVPAKIREKSLLEEKLSPSMTGPRDDQLNLTTQSSDLLPLTKDGCRQKLLQHLCVRVVLRHEKR